MLVKTLKYMLSLPIRLLMLFVFIILLTISAVFGKVNFKKR